MFEGIFIYFVIPIIVAIIGGAGSFVLSDKWNQKKLARKLLSEMVNDWEKYKGQWYGVHISRGANSDEFVLSHHKYDLNIESSGAVNGSFQDYLEDPPCEYDVQGRMTEGGLVLDSRCRTRRALVAVEVYTLPMTPTELKGVLVSYDYKIHHPFISFIVLTRDKLNDEEYMLHVENLKKERLYLELTKKDSMALPEASSDANALVKV